MVRALGVAGLMCLAAFPGPAASAASLRVEPEAATVEMGRHLEVEVTYGGADDPGFVSYGAWREEFATERLDRTVEATGEGVRVIESLRVFPRRTGVLKLHALRYGGALSRPAPVTVTPLVRDGIDATPRLRPLPATAWVDEPLEVAVAAARLHPTNRIIAHAFGTTPAFTVLELPPRRETGPGGGVDVLRWRLLPRRHGIHTVELPAIEQRGRGRWRFHLPLMEVEVRPLPSYLPAAVPVGAIAVASAVVAGAGGPAWRVVVTNPGRLPEEVHGLRTALARIGGVGVEGVALATTPGLAGPSQPARQVYTVPVPPWSWGLGPGPRLAVPYFDPAGGRVAERVHHLPPRWRVPPFALYLLAAAAIAAVAGIALAGHRGWRGWRRRRALRRAAATARDPHELRRLLLDAGGFRTLGAWADARGGTVATDIARRLNALCFARRAGPLPPDLGPAAARAHLGRLTPAARSRRRGEAGPG